ncbi:hypothetical protein [Rheinheimera sp. 4Y26]|uniref:hypothetical protein n=1 Tax=Rheinheimera sp. 4Y26 TaxID=2977811 RepID=UPI0021B0E8EF|nr:hypothetical protein [Rheinheimera sp. 4Y26]MCT6700692.1 hypothetical protein [Rheinheimera sp. 4Y26]
MKNLFGCVLLMLAACTPDQPARLTPERKVQLEQFQLIYAPGDMPVETPLVLRLNTGNEAVTAVRGHIVGKTMYMGKIPLQFSLNGQHWQAELMLGACSEPKMQWQLTIEVTYASGQQVRLQDLFYSRWP